MQDIRLHSSFERMGTPKSFPLRGRRSDFHGSLPSGRPTQRSVLGTDLSCTQTGSPRQDLHLRNSLRSPAYKLVWVNFGPDEPKTSAKAYSTRRRVDRAAPLLTMQRSS